MIWDECRRYSPLFLLLLLAFSLFYACSSPQVAVDKVQVIYSGNMWGYLEPCPT